MGRMKVLRVALLLGAFSVAALPAAALEMGSTGGQFARASAAKLNAVEAALEATDKSRNALEQAILADVSSFYEARGYRPLWFNGSDVSSQLIALKRRMAGAASLGLDPDDYATPHVADRRYYNSKRLGHADVEFSLAVARFVAHLSSGRIKPTDVSRLITMEPQRPEIASVLTELSQAPSVDMALHRYEPQHPQYRALKAKLAELRALGEEDDRIVVPDGKMLKPGKSDERVALLRERLDIALPAETAATLYDETLVEAVRAFQEENGLSVDGIVGPQTLLALNGRSREEDIASILANMERWRWMPGDLGAFHVLVNVPEFKTRVFDDGEIVHETRVVVGKPRNPTPMFSHAIDHFVVNPYWNVPTSILKNEMMPSIRANPHGYFARHGYQVLANIKGRMRLVHPASVNWHAINPRSVRVRQTPGSHNALGRIKFMFPNQHSVYLHDTPSKSLFKRDRRAFSHGCVRVQNPLDFAAAILPAAAPDWNASRIERLYGGKERRVNLDSPVPVHLSYFTTAVAADGELSRFEDIYGYDRKMTEFLGS